MNKITKISLLSGGAVIAIAVVGYFVLGKKEKPFISTNSIHPNLPSSSELETAPPQNKETTKLAKYPFQGIVNTNSSDLNMREHPSTTAPIMTKLPKGKKVQILSKRGAWYETNLGGWVHSDYIKFLKQI